MKTSFLILILLAFLTIPAAAQLTPPYFYQPLAQVRQFLELTDSQFAAILRNNDEYNRWSIEKQRRIAQLQTEIAQETAKSPLSPDALGIRYAEIEVICRQMKDRATASLVENQVILTDPQRAKLKLLQDALQLLPVISEAQYGNLLGPVTSPPLSFTGASGGISTVVGAFIGPVNGCNVVAPTPWFDTTTPIGPSGRAGPAR